jgi:hypothetical protein
MQGTEIWQYSCLSIFITFSEDIVLRDPVAYHLVIYSGRVE